MGEMVVMVVVLVLYTGGEVIKTERQIRNDSLSKREFKGLSLRGHSLKAYWSERSKPEQPLNA